MAASKHEIHSVLTEARVFPPPEAFARRAHIRSMEQYQQLWDEAAKDPDKYWGDRAREELYWKAPFQTVLDWKPPHARWFVEGKTNLAYNCLDRHLATRKDKPAILFEGEPGDRRSLTYGELSTEVNKLANALKSLGVRKGDRVGIYLPMVPEAAVAMLACARIGAVHSVVFGGFSAEALHERMNDAGAKVLLTADGGWRKGAVVPLLKNVEAALPHMPTMEKVVVLRRTGSTLALSGPKLVAWDTLVSGQSAECEPEWVESEHPLFILYTSGSTGKPKGVLHTTGGYAVNTSLTTRWVFDLREDDVYWCTADVGWVTGHSYVVYGPLMNGVTTILYEGAPTQPGPDRFWDIIERYKATILYTAPTALRSLIKEGDAWVKKSSRQSLRLLGSVGEPINPEVWRWYHDVVGEGRCPVVDTWWQTETGGILIAPLPGATPTKPGSATLPFFGVEPVLVDDEGRVIEGNGVSGNLCLARSWPGQARTLYGHHQRFKETYYARFPNLYFTGDGCRRDEDGYYWITGRVDDVLNVSGHRLGTAEVESALVAHEAVAEAAVVGFPHDLKGTGVCAFVTVKPDWQESASEQMVGALKEQVRHVIGPIATPDRVVLVNGLPKTRSGKILRRMLRKIASGEVENLGDASTLADPSVLDELLAKATPPQAKR